MFAHHFQAHTQHFLDKNLWFNRQRHANTNRFKIKKNEKNFNVIRKREKNSHNISERDETIIIAAVIAQKKKTKQIEHNGLRAWQI